MKNLLEETLNILKEVNKSPEDIVYIGDKNGIWQIDWTDFSEIADRIYDNDFGYPEVNPNLIIIFNDESWLERREYDGAEWWEYKKPPKPHFDAPKKKDKDLIFGDFY